MNWPLLFNLQSTYMFGEVCCQVAASFILLFSLSLSLFLFLFPCLSLFSFVVSFIFFRPCSVGQGR